MMNAVVCAIAKNENDYINDWVNWYLRIGFDHIYLFDNNDSSSEHIYDYIDNLSKVTIYNINDVREEGLQAKCYNKFYLENRYKFDWCLFCDIDEFLVGVSDIKEFLSNRAFNEFEQIRVTWKTFSDGNLIDRDLSIPVYDAFKVLSENKRLNKQAKSIIRGGLESISISPHRGIRINSEEKKIENLISCFPSGRVCETDGIMTEGVLENDDIVEKETVFLNHYRTKSLKEFIVQKLNRGNACALNKITDWNYYWISNRKTEEKERFIEEYLKTIDDYKNEEQ